MKVERSQVLQLSINDTRVLKGVALFMLLCHHCLYTGNEYDDVVVFGYPLFKSFGVFCKLCVSIFVFLSGYGLTICALRNNGIGQPIRFYKRRYVKLMINYWLIWLIFVPVGVLCFERTFPEVYGDYYILKGIVDFFGLYNAVFYTPYGYNATWWFYGCIIVLYLLFPLIWYFRNYWFLMIPLALFMPVLGRIPIFGSSGAFGYLLPFICGMTFASEKLRCVEGGGKIQWKILLLFVFILICGYRIRVSNPIMWDTVIIVWGVYLYKLFPAYSCISNLFAFFGKHSFNIFLFHTFIYAYYFHDYIYWSRNPIVIIATLLIACIIISILLEWLKATLRINKLQEKLLKQQ